MKNDERNAYWPVTKTEIVGENQYKENVHFFKKKIKAHINSCHSNEVEKLVESWKKRKNRDNVENPCKNIQSLNRNGKR